MFVTNNLNDARNLICKVIPVWLEPDLLEEVNLITGIYQFRESNWCNKDEFIEHEELLKYVDNQIVVLLMNDEIDYIAFRMEC